MFIESRLLMMKVLSPVHVGIGQDLGLIDMPIQREATTSFPKIESSTIKGCFRERIQNCSGKEKAQKIFGKREIASNIVITDAKLLLFPVSSLTSIFSLITCPYVITRFLEELEHYLISNHYLNKSSSLDYLTKAKSINKLKSQFDDLEISSEHCIALFQEKMYLEEYIFSVNDRKKRLIDLLIKEIEEVYQDSKAIQDIKNRIVVINDDTFNDFVRTYTEKNIRNKINHNTKTTEEGCLFTEEYLPSESILYSTVLSKAKKIEDNYENRGYIEDFQQYFDSNNTLSLYVGGSTALGKGHMKFNLVNI